MRPLSKIDLLSKGLHDLAENKKGLHSYLLAKFEKYARNELHIQLPRYEVLRANSFLDDVMELTDHTIHLNIEDLIALLFQQFLIQVRSTAKFSTLGQKILNKKIELAEKEHRIVTSFKEVNPNHWALVEKKVPIKMKSKQITVELHRKYIERGEIFLYDLIKISPKFDMTLEELISILVIDFVHEVEKGNSKKVMEQIIKSLEQT
ncbi:MULTISPECIES: hypothetical protein [Bacillales]|uniref:hypothetical protein n=1 Tax=Bacillales TaxID=1385 RepID=UPI00339A078E